MIDIEGGGAQGSQIITWPHHGGLNQQWKFDEDGTIRSGNDMVLDIKEGKLEPGTPVIAWEKTGGENQKWRVVHL